MKQIICNILFINLILIVKVLIIAVAYRHVNGVVGEGGGLAVNIVEEGLYRDGDYIACCCCGYEIGSTKCWHTCPNTSNKKNYDHASCNTNCYNSQW